MPLSKKELKRYSRQTILPNMGISGQKKLANATATVIGLGALGSIISDNLTRAGIGKLRIADRDVVELENLHRQSLYDEQVLGVPKAIAAAKRLRNINSNVKIIPLVKDVNFSTIETIISDSDIILDGTDNLETRFLINDLSIKKGIPWVYGGVIGTQGMSMNIIANGDSTGPCFRCLVSEIPSAGSLPTCDTFGILNTVPVIIGSLQSTEALKIILNSPNINRKLIFYDVWNHEFRTLEVMHNNNCKCCVELDFEFLQVKKRTIVTSLCGSDSVQIVPIKSGELSLDEFAKKLARIGKVKRTEFTIEFSIDKYKITIFSDGRVLIKGTTDDSVAKSLYTKYIGN